MSKLEPFSKSSIIEQAWELTKANFWFLFSLAFAVVLISNIPNLASAALGEKSASLALVGLIWIIQIFLSLGVIQVSLHLARNKPVRWSDLWTPRHLFWRYLGGSILYGLIVFFGLLLLLVPGIIWSIKYQFFTYALVDKDLSVWQVFEASDQMTRGHKGNILLFNILLSMINILGLILLIIGLLAAMPITWLAMALLYQKLTTMTQTNHDK